MGGYQELGKIAVQTGAPGKVSLRRYILQDTGSERVGWPCSCGGGASIPGKREQQVQTPEA